MVNFKILDKVRRKPKGRNASDNDLSAAAHSSNHDHDGHSSYDCSEEDSYHSSDSSFYSSSAASSDDDNDDDLSCESEYSDTVSCEIPDIVRAIAQYAPLNICKANYEKSSKAQVKQDEVVPEKVKEETNTRRRGFKSFDSILKGLDTGRSKGRVERNSVDNVQTKVHEHEDGKDNTSFTEKIQKQFQEWTDQVTKFESLHLLNAYHDKTEEDMNATAAAAVVSKDTPKDTSKDTSKDTIESRNENDEDIRDELDKRDESVVSPRKARSFRFTSRKPFSPKARGRSKSQDRNDSFKRMAILSPRLTTNAIRPILSPRRLKQNVFSPKNDCVASFRKKREKVSRRHNDDIDIDELVAHVIRKRSSDASCEQDGKSYMHQTSSTEKSSDTCLFAEKQQESEATTKQLELAQKEIEYLKRLLQEKERVSCRDDVEKVTSYQTSFNLSDEKQSSESVLSSNQINRGVSDKDSSGYLMNSRDSHEDIFSQEDMFPFAATDFGHNARSAIDEFTPRPDDDAIADPFWDNMLANTGSGCDDHDDDVSLLSNTFSPRRYGKLKRISRRRVLK